MTLDYRSVLTGLLVRRMGGDTALPVFPDVVHHPLDDVLLFHEEEPAFDPVVMIDAETALAGRALRFERVDARRRHRRRGVGLRRGGGRAEQPQRRQQ